LRPRLSQNLPESYRRAARRAVIETGLARRSFPTRCPYSVEQIVDEDFLPE